MRRAFLGVLLSVGLAVPAAAQSNNEMNAYVQFDFLSPGARSLAMGGAFIGNADDSTAAFVNPAGLRAISRKELSIEGRGRNFAIPVIVRGHLGLPANVGIDTISGLQEVDQSQDAAGLAYFSFVLPQPRWAIAAYRHELANFEIDAVTEGPFFDLDAERIRRRLPLKGTLDLNITTYGVSGSFNVTQQLSVGGGVAVYDFGMDTRTDRFSVARGFFAPPDYSASNLANYPNETGDDTAVGVNVGALYAPHRMFQVGVVFRQGPEFTLRVANNDPLTDQPFPGREFEGRFNVPHVFGVGAAIRPINNLTISTDIARVGYSRMTDGFIDIFPLPSAPDTPGDGVGPNESDFYSVEDATEFHAGAEYVLDTRIPIALRGGYWRDPAHSLVYSGSRVDERQWFREREDEHHFAFGGGVVFGRFEINAGGDVADRTKIFSLSGVVRF